MTTATKKRPTSADAPAESPPKQFVLTASLADLARKQREAVRDFPLTATSEHLDGTAIARVRLVDLADSATLTSLPETLLRKVLTIANDVEIREGRTNPVQDDGSLNIDRAIRVAKANARAIDAYCVAGFVEPVLILAESDRTSKEQVLVSNIHPADRQRFFDWCQGRHTEAAATVEPFPDGSTEGVATGGSGGMDGAAAESAAPAAGDGEA